MKQLRVRRYNSAYNSKSLRNTKITNTVRTEPRSLSPVLYTLTIDFGFLSKLAYAPLKTRQNESPFSFS